MRVELLGAVALRAADGNAVELGGPMRRALLARLALDASRLVPVAVLIEDLWGEHPPSGPANALQSQVSRIRRAIRSTGDEADELHLTSTDAGYRLDVDPQLVDVHRFASLVGAGRSALRDGDALRAAGLLGEAESLWRGPALADLVDVPFAARQAIRLDDARLEAAELRFAALGELRQDIEVLDELGQLARSNPLREPLQALWMRALARTGRVAEALRVFENSRRELSEQLGVDPSAVLAAAHLDVLRSTESLASPRAAGRAVGRAAGRAVGLPEPVTTFVGRERELAAARSVLASHRLLTLVGTGGAGKTRLAMATASQLVPDVAAHVALVELAPIDDGVESVVRAVLGAVGHPELAFYDSAGGPSLRPGDPGQGDPRGATGPVDRLVAALRGRDLLLVLDNCEHLLDAAATVASAVLAGCRSVRLLVTSRERLGIDGERLLPVDPLPLPPAGASWSEALRYPSVRLFADRADAVRPGTAPEGRETEAVVEICRRLDGLPLALELAAARLRHRSAVEVAARLDDRFRLLTGGSRTALPRHQTLHAVVSWSWDLLDDAERAMLRRLSVTAGATTAAAAAAVFGTTDVPGGTVAVGDAAAPDGSDVLDALLDKSLLVAVRDGDPDGRTRYRMLDTVQAFARDKLADAGSAEGDAARQAHATFFVELADRAEAQLRGPEQLVWMRRLRADHENLLAALRWAIEAGRCDEAVRLGAAMGWLWTIEGHHLTVLHWLGPVVALADDVERQAVTGATAVGAEAQVRVLHATNYGVMDDEPNRMKLFERARPVVQRALSGGEPAGGHVAGGRAAGGPCRGGFVELFDAMDAMWRRDLELVAQLTAQVVARDDADDWTRAAARLFAGQSALAAGRLDVAREQLGEAAALFRTAGDRWGLVQASTSLGELQSLAGRSAEAISWANDNAELAAELGALDDAAAIRAQVGVQRARTGDTEGALAEIAAARTLSAAHGPGIGPAIIEICVAEIRLLAGDVDEAAAGFATAELAFADFGGLQECRVIARSGLAAAAAEAGDVNRAWRLHREAVELATTAHDVAATARAAEVAAVTAARFGDLRLAATLLGVALGVRGAYDLGDPRVRRTRDTAAATLGTDELDRRLAAGAELCVDGAGAPKALLALLL